MTPAEHLLWWTLREFPVRFRRQVPIGPFVADFAAYRPKLVIEVDGSQHADSESDARRDHFLRSRGFCVLRFWNREVLTESDHVREVIGETIDRL